MLSLSVNKPSAGTVLDGRFEILSTLGNGAMSVVVAARHLQLRQTVAIKMLRPEYATYQDVVTRFLREARAAASLRNEHVVSVTDVGMLPTGVPYLIMEYLEGTDLAAHLAAHGPLSVDLAVEYVFQVLEALAEAHRAGIVHRDIKPANLLLTRREDGSALVKVLDFGVSKLTGPEYTAQGLTMHSPLLGSPAYMSPEQIQDPSSVDARTDIWSVGIVLYELVTGQLPFSGRTAPELVSAICSPQPTPISGLISHAPIELVSVIGRCVHKNRDARFPNVQELARALVPFVRTAASQVSVDRILGIASAPRPVVPELLEQRRSHVTVTSSDTIRDPMPSMARPHSVPVPVRAGLAALGVLAVCAVGWRMLGSSGAPVPGSPSAEADSLRAEAPAQCAPQAASSANACAPSEPASISTNSPTVSASPPPVATGATDAATTARKTARAPRPRTPSAPPEPEATATAAPPQPADTAPSSRAILSYPGSRPLDPDNPYARK